MIYFTKITTFFKGNHKSSIPVLILILFITICIIIFNPVSAYEKTNLPIIMYHSILKDDTKSSCYITSLVSLEKDLIYLKDEGYTSITQEVLIDFLKNGEDLPEKPILLTFDDGFYNNFLYVIPLLEKYEMHGVFAINGEFTQTRTESFDGEIDTPNPAYSYASFREIAKVNRENKAEFSNHSFSLHKNSPQRHGATKKDGETFESYRNVFLSDTAKMEKMMYEKGGIKVQSYTFPFGFYCEESIAILNSLGYKIAYSCEEKVNLIEKNTVGVTVLGRFNRDGTLSTEDFMAKIKD